MDVRTGAVLSPHTGSCCGARQGLLSGLGPLCARLWLLLFGPCEGNQEESTFSEWLTQTLGTHPGHPRRGAGPLTSPRAKSTRENQMLPTQRQLTILACSGPTSRGSHLPTTAFSPKRDTYS